MPQRRYAKQTLSSQIAINSFSRKNVGTFSRTRYEDLLFFFQQYAHPRGPDAELFENQTLKIVEVLDGLWSCFGDRAADLKNRSYILSVFLLFEEIGDDLASQADRDRFRDFVLTLWERLKKEAKAGMDRQNRDLFEFDSMLSSAPGERYQIDRRHSKFLDFYEHYREGESILGYE